MGLFLLSGAATAVTPALPSYSVALTGYNAVSEQTDNDPLVTASGAFSNPEVVAARSRDLASELPFGTIIEVDGPIASQDSCGYGIVAPAIGYRVIADTMNARYTNRVDILFGTKSNYIMADGSVKNASVVLGICANVTIRIVGYIDLTHPGKLPKTQAELAALVRGDNSLSLK